MKEILTLRAKLIDTAKQKTLDNIADTRRIIRERAIHTLTSRLDPNKEGDIIVFHTLPLEFIQRGDLIGAIWYTETVGKMGNSVPFEVFEQVVEKALSERAKYVGAGDEEGIKVLDGSIDALFRMARTHLTLAPNPKLTLLDGLFESERGNPHKALSLYDKGIEAGEIDAYILSARLYEKLGHVDMSRKVLEIGYRLTGNLGLLSHLVRIACKQDGYTYALGLYDELAQISNNTIPPFLVYKECIQSDRDLEELESIIASYAIEGSMIPTESLTLLAEKAGVYIAEQIRTINNRINFLNQKPLEQYTDEEKIEYGQSIFNRLWYMQIDILTLGNVRCLATYLNEIDRITFGDLKLLQGALSEFFTEHFSVEVHQQSKHGGEMHDSPLKTIRPNTLYEDVSFHVARIGELFSHATFYDIHEGQIVPILRKSAKEEGVYDDDFEDKLSEVLGSIRDGYHYFSSLKSSVRENYENFIRGIDTKYGVFHRKHIQNIAINPDIVTDKYPQVLLEYPDIALLFCIEKLIAGIFPADYQKIENIVRVYGLDRCDIASSLLFGTLIYDVSIEYAISFLVSYPNMLDVPEAIYIITEGLRQMEPKERKQAIKDLHKLAQDEYGARGFFEHIRFTFGDIIRNGDPSEKDQNEMLLASGNVAILQGKPKEISLLNFHTAGMEYSSLDGLLQAGDSYEDMGEYDKALWYFEQAFVQESSIATLSKILHLAIRSARFELAHKYIQYGLSKSYSIGSYILAYHLWQGQTEGVLIQMITMIKNRDQPLDNPAGTIRLLFKTLDDIIKMPDSNNEITDILKIQASFILANIGVGNNTPDAFSLFPHWQYVVSLMDSYESTTLHRVIEQSLAPIVWNLEDIELDGLSDSDKSVAYISEHVQNILHTCELRMKGENNTEKLGKHLQLMNEIVWGAITALRRFPNSEKEVAMLLSELEFTPSENYKPIERNKKEPTQYIH